MVEVAREVDLTNIDFLPYWLILGAGEDGNLFFVGKYRLFLFEKKVWPVTT